MRQFSRLRHLFATTIFVFLAALSLPVQAGQAEVDLLQSYVGSWRGEGMLTGGDEPEAFRCRLSVVKGSETKVNYAGRCSLVGMNLSINGTISFSDANNRYEAAMTSNTDFSGMAVGRKRGNSIIFDLSERETTKEGNELTIGSKILLKDGKITVEFDVTFSDSNETMNASVPFNR